MRKIYWLSLLFLYLQVVGLGYSQEYSQGFLSGGNNMTLVTVDGFEKEGDWVVKYSKYRSKNWSDDLSKAYESGDKWLKWLKLDDFQGKNKYNILPQHIQMNSVLSQEKTILGIRGKWDREAYNWFVLEPRDIRASSGLSDDSLSLVADKDNGYLPIGKKWDRDVNPNFIWMPGKVKDIFIFVWSGDYDYKLEAHFQDYKGNEYVVPIGDLNYKGWRSLGARIPRAMMQTQKRVPSSQPLKFLRFKVTSGKDADPKDVYVYVDYFHVTADIYREIFFGVDLKNVDNIWSEEGGGESVGANEN